MMKIDGYKDFVEDLAKKGEDKVFFNSGPIHASIVMSRIFKYSTNTIRIFSGGFHGAVSNDSEYLCELDSFLSRGGKVKVLVENYNSNNNSKIYKILSKYFNTGQIEIKKTTARVNSGGSPIHFTIGDDRMLRLETNVNDFKAQVNFNNSKETAVFIEVFDKIFNISDPSKNSEIKLN